MKDIVSKINESSVETGKFIIKLKTLVGPGKYSSYSYNVNDVYNSKEEAQKVIDEKNKIEYKGDKCFICKIVPYKGTDIKNYKK
jgi:hypothetical protein